MVSVLHPLDELAQLQDAGSIFCVTECENVAARYGRDESIGDEVRKLDRSVVNCACDATTPSRLRPLRVAAPFSTDPCIALHSSIRFRV